MEQQHDVDGHEYVLQGYSTLKKELEPNKLNEPDRSIKSSSQELQDDINEKSKHLYLEHSTDRNMLPNYTNTNTNTNIKDKDVIPSKK